MYVHAGLTTIYNVCTRVYAFRGYGSELHSFGGIYLGKLTVYCLLFTSSFQLPESGGGGGACAGLSVWNLRGELGIEHWALTAKFDGDDDRRASPARSNEREEGARESE